jgi:hypothetical protein
MAYRNPYPPPYVDARLDPDELRMFAFLEPNRSDSGPA